MNERPKVVEELPPEEQIKFWLNQAVEILERDLDVRDLTTTEILQLRKFVEEARNLRLYFKEKYLGKGMPKAYKLNTVQVSDEALTRYLDFYGIDIKQIHEGYAYSAIQNNSENREYIKRKLKLAREEMHNP